MAPPNSDLTQAGAGGNPPIDYNDPDFKALSLQDKHSVMMATDPDYKALSPKDQSDVLNTIHYGAPPKQEENFLSRTTGAHSIDELKDQLKSGYQKVTQENEGYLQHPGTILPAVYHDLPNLGTIKNFVEGLGENAKNYSEDINNKNYGAAAGDFAATGAKLIPLASGVPQVKALATETIPETLEAAGNLVSENTPKVVKNAIKNEAQNLNPLTPSRKDAFDLHLRATAPNGLGAEDMLNEQQTFNRASPYLQDEFKGRSIDEGPNGAVKAAYRVGSAKDRLWNTRIQPVIDNAKPYMGDGSPVADAIRQSYSNIDRVMKPGAVSAGNSLANYFDRPMTVGEMSDELTKLNNDKTVSRYFNASQGEQAQMLLSDPAMQGKIAATNALRENMMDTIERVSPPDTVEPFRTARGDWGALKDVQQRYFDAKIPAPESKMSKVGNTVRGVVPLGGGGPHAYMKGGESLFSTSNPDKLIPRAMNKLAKAGDINAMPPEVGPTQPFTPTTRMLPAPDPRLGPVPDSSGSIPYVPPSVDAASRASRLGMVLPPAGGSSPESVPLGASAEAPNAAATPPQGVNEPVSFVAPPGHNPNTFLSPLRTANERNISGNLPLLPAGPPQPLITPPPNPGVPPEVNFLMGNQEQTPQMPNMQPAPPVEVNSAVAPQGNQITYSKDSNGMTWASRIDSPAKVSIPESIVGTPAADSYAHQHLDLQKNFAADRANLGKRTPHPDYPAGAPPKQQVNGVHFGTIQPLRDGGEAGIVVSTHQPGSVAEMAHTGVKGATPISGHFALADVTAPQWQQVYQAARKAGLDAPGATNAVEKAVKAAGYDGYQNPKIPNSAFIFGDAQVAPQSSAPTPLRPQGAAGAASTATSTTPKTSSAAPSSAAASGEFISNPTPQQLRDAHAKAVKNFNSTFDRGPVNLTGGSPEEGKVRSNIESLQRHIAIDQQTSQNTSIPEGERAIAAQRAKDLQRTLAYLKRSLGKK